MRKIARKVFQEKIANCQLPSTLDQKNYYLVYPFLGKFLNFAQFYLRIPIDFYFSQKPFFGGILREWDPVPCRLRDKRKKTKGPPFGTF